MRILGGFCFIWCIFSCYAEDTAKVESKVYADISEAAQDAAVSFGGIRALLGISLLFQKFFASIGNKDNFTENTMNVFGISTGMEYAKEFRYGFLVAINFGADISQKGKKEDSWNALNREYETQRGAIHGGIRTGKFESDVFSPYIAIKGGYLLPRYKSVIFVKIGASQVGGIYHYKQDENIVCNVGVKALVPSIGIGVERKMNNKFGISLEANLPIKKIIKRQEDNVEHKIKVGNVSIRLLATYSVLNN
jgi:hypothetical protein